MTATRSRALPDPPERETAQEWAERMVRERGKMPDELLRRVARILRGND